MNRRIKKKKESRHNLSYRKYKFLKKIIHELCKISTRYTYRFNTEITNADPVKVKIIELEVIPRLNRKDILDNDEDDKINQNMV